MPEFREFPKIARFYREIVITEKIDGTNAAVGVTEDGEVYAQSRTRIITPENDNFGFARWVAERQDMLRDTLGPGLHFGEWWGQGIQRGYDLKERRFSLFNVARWGPVEDAAELGPDIHIVPTLYQGPINIRFYNRFNDGETPIEVAIAKLRAGSLAAPGFPNPEGIVIYHTAAKTAFKITLERDEEPKGKTR